MLSVYETKIKANKTVGSVRKIGEVENPEDVVDLIDGIERVHIENDRFRVESNGDGSYLASYSADGWNRISWDLYPESY